MRILQRNVKHKITFSLNFTASKTQVPKDSTQSTTFYLTIPKYYLEHWVFFVTKSIIVLGGTIVPEPLWYITNEYYTVTTSLTPTLNGVYQGCILWTVV